MARQFAGPIMYALKESDMHRAIWPQPECRPDEKRGWSHDSGVYLQGTSKLRPWPAFRSLGYWASAIGGRANGIILDDPLTQAQNESDTDMEKARSTFHGTINTRPYRDPPGWILGIMTSFREADFAHFLANLGTD